MEIHNQIVRYPAKHLRVLGPAGSGKTELLLERYAALGDTGTFILTYSRESHRRITDVVHANDEVRVGASPVLTHHSLAQEVIATSGRSTPRILEEFEEDLLLERVIAAEKTKLASSYRKITESDGFRRELLDVFHFLLQHNIHGERLELFRDTNGRYLHDVLHLYTCFVTEMKSKRLATYYDLSWRAVAALSGGTAPHPLGAARTLLVDDMQDIDAGQYALLRAIAPPEGPVALNVFGDAMGSLFGFRGTSARYLDNFPKEYDCETLCLKASTHAGAAPLFTRLLEETLGDASKAFAPDGGEELSNGETTGDAGIRFELAKDEVEEARIVASAVHRLIVDDGVAPKDVAILTNQKTRYEAILKLAFDQRGVPLQTDALTRSGFEHFVITMLSSFVGGDDVRLRSVVTSPFFEHFEDACLEKTEDKSERSRRLSMRKFLEDTESKSSKWFNEFVRAALLPTCQRFYDDTGDDSVFKALSDMTSAWDAYVLATETIGRPPELGAFVRILRNRSKGAPRPFSHTDRVGLHSARELKGWRCPHVFVVGCSELLFPSAAVRTSMMPINALQKVLDEKLTEHGYELYGARSPESHLKEEYHLLYLCLTRATESIFITAPQQFSGRRCPAPALVIREAVASGASHETADETKLPPQIHFAREWVRSPSADLASVLKHLNPMAALWSDVGTPPAFQVDPFALSKSSLEDFIKCERLFFYRKILRVPQDDILTTKMGNLYHSVMAELGQSFTSKGALVDDGEASAAGVIERTVAQDRDLASRPFLRNLHSFHLGQMVRQTLRLYRDAFDDYVDSSVEETLDFERGKWKYRGRLDLVEKTASGGRMLVDYKSGKVDKRGATIRSKVLIDPDRLDRTNWQVPLYLWGYKTASDGTPREFRHICAKPGEDAFFVTLFVGETEAELVGDVKRGSAYSYLTWDEIEKTMEAADSVAADIFSTRESFPKTDAKNNCRNCEFRGVCNRES